MDMRVQEGAVTLPTSGSGPVKVIESVLVSQWFSEAVSVSVREWLREKITYNGALLGNILYY